jgi:hypothetical protein
MPLGMTPQLSIMSRTHWLSFWTLLVIISSVSEADGMGILDGVMVNGVFGAVTGGIGLGGECSGDNIIAFRL